MSTDDDPRHDLLRYYTRYHRPGVTDLSSSNPPPPVLNGRFGRLEPNDLSYVPPTGAEELREAIARRYETVGAGDILLTAGASEGLAALAFALVEPGRTVAVDRGTYPSFVEAAKTAGGRVVTSCVPVPGAVVATICNPTVPDGRVACVERFVEEAERGGAVAVVDEVYRDLVHNGSPAPAAADVSTAAVSVGGLSKPLGMGGLRIGWMATHNAELRERLDRRLQLLSGGPASLSVIAAAWAFEQYDHYVADTLAAVRANGPRVFAVLDDAGWQYERPSAGLTVEARPPGCVGLGGEARVRDAGMFLIPCDMYGAPGAYRISLLADPAALRQALSLLTEASPTRRCADTGISPLPLKSVCEAGSPGRDRPGEARS